ncbi:insecticyanin-B [Manduca sexta]|uniref:Insecticyanin-B n=1 Tax=Manduca sexta TaxID=7130 RepID=ICYB_MANSE|nr:insecticyanin-B [Manduca sexta]Q00630.1 RecName: Full=Insecticyanin-B; Short=INS-b; AltName: Full=Blue biliprotein; Flags: Precursor [Manduca sexta]CAA45970.1 unnamed protein product [Manduca sexta]
MQRFLVFTIVAVATAAAGDIFYPGYCPDVKPVDDFDLSAFAGAWHEIAKLPLENENQGKCTIAEYKYDGKKASVYNSFVVNGVKEYMEGDLEIAPDAKYTKQGKYVMTFKFGQRVVNLVPWVLATDYKNYAINYNCNYHPDKKAHSIHAWILSKSKVLEGNTKEVVDNVLKTFSHLIDASKFISNDFSEAACQYSTTYSLTGPDRH